MTDQGNIFSSASAGSVSWGDDQIAVVLELFPIGWIYFTDEKTR